MYKTRSYLIFCGENLLLSVAKICHSCSNSRPLATEISKIGGGEGSFSSIFGRFEGALPLNVTHAKISLRDTVSLELGEAAVSAKPAVFSFFISGFAQFLFESFGRRFQFVMESESFNVGECV